MKNALKQICWGLALSLMTVSMTLAPIPQYGVVYAQGVNQEDCYDPEKDGESERLYKPGCELDGIIKKTKFENYTNHQSSIMAILEQAVAGMMGVVMIQSLTHGYLYEVDPMLYGNDCSSNKAGKYTLRIAQLGSLAYILGDIKANMDFKKASQKATDNAFSAPTNVPAGADAVGVVEHKNDQIKSFDTLIEVFEGQKKGIKSKQALSLLAEGAYGASLGLELAGIAACNAQCAVNKGLSKAYVYKFGSMISTAITAASAKATKAAVCPGPTCNPAAAAACSAAASSMGVFSGKFTATVAAKTAADIAETAPEAVDEASKGAFWAGLWTKAKDFFSSESAGLNAVGKLPTEELADDAIRGVQYTVEETKMITEFTTDQANVGTVVALVKACSAFDMPVDGPALEASAKSALNAYVNYNYAPIECCGGDGLSLVQQNSLYAHNTVLASEINTLMGEPSIPMAQNIVKAKASEKAQVEMMERGFENITSQIDVAGGSTIVNPFKAMGAAQIIKGTLVGYGVPEVSKFTSTKDMRVFGIFGDAAETGMKAPENFKYYVKKNFESLLIKLALQAQMEKLNASSPSDELEEIAELNKKVEKIMFHFNKLVDQERPQELAQGKFQSKKSWKNIISMVGELVMPSAHAFLSSVGGQVAAGVGLKMVSDQLGLKGPWSGILNVGAQFMIMNAMLGKYARSWGLVSPKGRAYTWGAMAAINLAVLMLDKKAEKKIDRYIDAVKKERDRYIKSAGVANLDDPNREKETRDGSGKLKRKDGQQNNMYAMEGSSVKSCAVAKGDGFAPSVCPAPATKSQFNLPQVERNLANSVTPAHLEGAQFVSKISKGLATGSVGASDLATLNLEKMEKRNLAMRKFNEKQMKKLDKEEVNRFKKQKANPTPLAQLIANAKKAISSSSGTLNNQPQLSDISNYNSNEENTEESQKNKVTKTSVYGSNPPQIKGAESQPGYDLNLFDEAGGGGEAVAVKAQENLEDFVINHDDINKKKNVSIFKILSNRYLLSYPKVLEEK